MPLTIISGSKKTGKTEFIFNELKKNKDSIIIVPEQTLFLYEKNILERLGEERSFDISILSFKKLAHKLIKEDENFNRVKLLDKDTKNLIIEKILLNNRNSLLSFKNAVSSSSLCEKIGAQISEFKKYLIDKDKIISLSDSEGINKNLKDKLKDLSFIFTEYEDKIKDIYMDFDNLIKTASDKIISEKLYYGKKIYIDSFTGFTGEELYMIKALLKNECNVFITLGEIKDRFKTFGDLSYTVHNTKKKLINEASSVGCKAQEIVLDKSYIENDDIRFLADNFLITKKEDYLRNAQSIKITKSRSINKECDLAVSYIIKALKEDNAHLNEMAVILPDMKEYGPYIKESLSKFGLCFYSNEKKSVYDMPVASLLNNVFNIVLSGNRIDVILGYLKSGYFFKDNPDLIYKFERFILKTGVRAYQLMGKPFLEILEEKKSFNFKIDNEDGLKKVYDNAIYPMVKLKEKIINSKTARDYSLALYEYFCDISIDKTLIEYSKEYEKSGDIVKGKQLIQVYNYILESLERTTLILSDSQVSFLEYKNIIISGLKNKNIASVPILYDSVFITEPSGFFNDSYKYIYVLGANEGNLPSYNFADGVINEDERKILKDMGIELSMSRELKMMENNLKVYDIITSPEKYLYISYSDYSKSASEQMPSEFVSEIKEIFKIDAKYEKAFYSTKRNLLKDTLTSFSKKTMEEEKDNIAYLCYDEKYLKIIEDTLLKIKNPDFKNVSVNPSNIKKLIGDTLRVSTTNMEKYNKCGFSYFIQYVLRAKENEEFTINSANLGSVMHLILEKFSKSLMKDNKDFSDVDDSYINEKLDKIIKDSIKETENGVFASDIKGEVYRRRLKATAYKTIMLIRKHFLLGSFKTVGFEVDFGKVESENQGIVFDAGQGRKIILNGVIDRVDKFKKDDDEYIRIVDYKSTEKTLDFYEVVLGLKMQLAIYLMTAIGTEKIDKIKPGGMLYLSLKSPVISISSPTDTDKFEAEIRKKITMKGFYLNSSSIAEAMDKNLKENKTSEIVDIELDKEGVPKNKNTMTIKEFETLLKFVRGNIEDKGKKIFDGKFPILPIKENRNTSCDYCPYSSICMYDNDNFEMINIKKMSRDEIFGVD